MPGIEFLAARLEEAGLAVTRLETAKAGAFTVAAVAKLRDGSQVFAKAQEDADADFFDVEAAGLTALRELGSARVPDVIHVSPRLLVLEALRPRGDGEQFWEQLGRLVAELHTSTVSDRFGWHRDGWHGPGRMRQENSPEADGHAFYAQHRPRPIWPCCGSSAGRPARTGSSPGTKNSPALSPAGRIRRSYCASGTCSA